MDGLGQTCLGRQTEGKSPVLSKSRSERLKIDGHDSDCNQVLIEQATEQWDGLQSVLRACFAPHDYSNLIRSLTVVQATSDTVTLLAPSGFLANRIRVNLIGRLQAIWTRDGKDPRTLFVRANKLQGTAAPPAAVSATPASFANTFDEQDQLIASVGRAEYAVTGSKVIDFAQPRRGFDTYEEGEANARAIAVANSLVESVVAAKSNPHGMFYDVVYIDGVYGVGKTHLAEAITTALNGHKNVRAMMISALGFHNGFKQALSNKTMPQFKAALAAPDLLVIDDIHLLCNGGALEAELFQTIAASAERQRPIVVCADVPADQLALSSGQMRSRLCNGYSVSIGLPDFALRRRITARKVSEIAARHPEFIVSPEGLDLIAGHVVGSCRLIEGAVKALHTNTTLIKKEVDLVAITQTLQNSSRGAGQVTVDRVKRVVAADFGITVDQLISKSRKREIARPRQIAMYIARNLTTRSFPDIARRMGDRHHATVMHAVDRIEELRKRDETMNRQIEALVAKLTT